MVMACRPPGLAPPAGQGRHAPRPSSKHRDHVGADADELPVSAGARATWPSPRSRHAGGRCCCFRFMTARRRRSSSWGKPDLAEFPRPDPARRITHTFCRPPLIYSSSTTGRQAGTGPGAGLQLPVVRRRTPHDCRGRPTGRGPWPGFGPVLGRGVSAKLRGPDDVSTPGPRRALQRRRSVATEAAHLGAGPANPAHNRHDHGMTRGTGFRGRGERGEIREFRHPHGPLVMPAHYKEPSSLRREDGQARLGHTRRYGYLDSGRLPVHRDLGQGAQIITRRLQHVYSAEVGAGPAGYTRASATCASSAARTRSGAKRSPPVVAAAPARAVPRTRSVPSSREASAASKAPKARSEVWPGPPRSKGRKGPQTEGAKAQLRGAPDPAP